MYPVDIIQSLSKTKSRIEKEQILLDAFVDGSQQFFIGVRLALDPLITFNVAKVAEVLEDDGAAGDFSFNDFLDLTKRLHRRELTGHAARDAIHAAADRCHVPTWNLFYRRILLKDLKVGIDEKTVNKVLRNLDEAERYLIPVFRCQLAHDGENHPKKIRGVKLIDVKMDGVRALTVLDKETGATTMFSRTGLAIDAFPELQTSLHGLLTRLPGSLVLDGELISRQGFQHLMTMMRRRQYHVDMASVRYALFDVIPLHDFRHGRCVKPQSERHAILETLQESGLWADTDGRVLVIPQVRVDLDTADGQAAYAEFVQQAILDGYEGVMIKDPVAPYECKRTVAWLKRKPVIEVTLPIVGFEVGAEGTKYEHTLGAVTCRGMDNDKMIETNVSGGLSDAMRDEIWHHQDQFLGLMLELRADRLTLEEGATTYSLRFPRWKGVRGWVPKEKM